MLDKIGHYDYILNVLVNHKIFFGWLIPLGTVDKYRTRPIADSKPFHCTTFDWKSQLYMTMIWTFLGSRHSSLDSYNLCRASDIAAEGTTFNVFSMTKFDPNFVISKIFLGFIDRGGKHYNNLPREGRDIRL